MRKVDFQHDCSEGVILTFSVLSMPQTNNHPGKDDSLKIPLENSSWPPMQEGKLPVTVEYARSRSLVWCEHSCFLALLNQPAFNVGTFSDPEMLFS